MWLAMCDCRSGLATGAPDGPAHLALAGEDPDAIRAAVRDALADRESLFRVREPRQRPRLPRAIAVFA
jgi:hypothetical protein